MRFLLLSQLVLLLLCSEVWAQGKIAGRVIDQPTRESLIGVNVVIEGTNQGSITDADGNYVIINVRPGMYTLIFSYVGYQTQRIEGVQVNTGQTTRYDLAMNETVIEGEEILVQAERPLIQKDLTASKKTVMSEEIDKLPVETFTGVLVTQAGVNQGPGGTIHIRGGRSNEVAYLVDGISVGDPFDTNGLATTVAVDAIQEMTVISGAFNAEYGKAMSGIVNLVTKEGGRSFEGTFSLQGGDTFTEHDDIFFTPSSVGLDIYTLEGTLGGPLSFLRDGNFFFSARHDVDEGYTFGIRQHSPADSANFNSSPIYYEIQERPWWEYLPADTGIPGAGRELPDELVPLHPSLSSNFIGKVTFRPFRSIKLEYSYIYDYSKRRPLNASTFQYRFVPDGVATDREDGYSHRVGFTHTIDAQTFYKLIVSYASNQFRRFTYENPNDERYVRDLGDIGDGTVVGFPGINFLMGGNQKAHINETSRSLRAKLDFTRQFGVIHEAKAGVEVQLHGLDRRNFVVLFNDDPLYSEGPTVPDVSTPSHDAYKDQRVVELSAYAQDKIEFDNFIINAGLRYEYFDPNGVAIANLLDPFGGGTTDASAKQFLLPRVGVSFPITSTGIIHFSYGHFAQIPRLRDLYRNPEFEAPPNTIWDYGNTNLRPERTVQYEIGLQQQIGDNMAFDVSGYFKDIRDYLATQRIQFSTIPGENIYDIFLNKDYANIRGVTFALTRRRDRNGLLSATIDYTFQVAEGNNDDEDAFFFNTLSGREDEFEIVPLDFDQQHIISSTVSLTRPGSWGASFISQFSTGYPYTPLLIDQKIDQLPNSGRKPSQFKLDAHLYKEFSMGEGTLRVFTKIFNVLDVLNERFVFNDTGRATYSLSDERGLHEAWEPFYDLPGIQDINSYDTRPHYYSSPREIRIGATLTF